MLCPAGSVSEECPTRRRKEELVADEEDAALEEEAAAWRVLALGGIPMRGRSEPGLGPFA